MKNFAAIDFETANEQRASVCSVGIVIVREGEIVDTYYSLIRPEPEYYTYWNTRVHGLTLADTAKALSEFNRKPEIEDFLNKSKQMETHHKTPKARYVKR